MNNLPPIRNKIDIQNSLEEAKREAAKEGRENKPQEEKPVQLSQANNVNQPAMDDPINPDPRPS